MSTPPGHTAADMNAHPSLCQQLELGLQNRPRRARHPMARRRFPAARWWFDRMRDAVRSAPDWPVRTEENAPTPS